MLWDVQGQRVGCGQGSWGHLICHLKSLSSPGSPGRGQGEAGPHLTAELLTPSLMFS